MERIFIIALCLMFSVLANAQEEKAVRINGVLRFNYNNSSWKPEQQKRGGDLGFETVIFRPSVVYKKLKFKADFRFYSAAFGGAMLKYGWVGYSPNSSSQFQLGLTQVPFGNEPFNSYSWFFSMPYYLGFEDDHDMGLKYILNKEVYQFQIAFFKNAETLNFGNASKLDSARYSYDLSGRNKEINQLNLKFAYKFGKEKSSNLNLSLMYGGIYNIVRQTQGNRYAVAVAGNFKLTDLELKVQAMQYAMYPDDLDEYTDIVEMAAFNSPYLVAAEGRVFTVGLQYTFSFENRLVDKVQVYNDFAVFDKTQSDYYDSFMNVLGFMTQIEDFYIYTDLGYGKDHPWLGPEWTNALGTGTEDAEWEYRFNINLGYYF